MTKTNEEEEQKKNIKVTFRVFQAIFLGIFALGVSSIFGDVVGVLEIPISGFSMTTTVFGLVGSFITGHLAKQSEKW